MNQAIDLVPDLQPERYILGLIAVARSDGESPEERAFIEAQASLLGVDAAPLLNQEHITIQGISEGCSMTTRRLILRDCVMLAHADGVYSEQEQAALEMLCNELDINPALIERFNSWLQRYDALLTEGHELITGDG